MKRARVAGEAVTYWSGVIRKVHPVREGNQMPDTRQEALERQTLSQEALTREPGATSRYGPSSSP